jgi:hypothetical protein
VSQSASAVAAATEAELTALVEREGDLGMKRVISVFFKSFFYKMYPSGYVKIAIENGHRNSGFSH